MKFTRTFSPLVTGVAGVDRIGGFNLIAGVADLLFPPLCLVCRQPPAVPRDRLCTACRGSMSVVATWHPVRLGAEARLTSGGMADAFLTMFLFEKEGALQQSLHLMKYSGMHSLGVMFGRELGTLFATTWGFEGAECLVPVPLHAARLRERGYNQSERICAGIREVTGTPIVTGTLVRTRNTPSQTTLKIHQREENVAGAFRVRKGREKLIRGRSVVLVDDVMTTGSTLLACSAALRTAGARSVLVATLAVAERTS